MMEWHPTHLKDVLSEEMLVEAWLLGRAWKQTASDQYLPRALHKLQNLSGFTANSLDTKMYEVLAYRKVYMNSKGSRHGLDHAEHMLTADGEYMTTPATTPAVRHAHISFKRFNKVVKQLESSINESTAGDSETYDADSNTPIVSNYSYDNVHPFSNVWCLISCSDTFGGVDWATDDRVKVECIRKVGWRDKLG